MPYDVFTLSILRGNGDGTFAGRTIVPTGRFPKSVAIGALDADGVPDLAVGSDAAVSVYRGNGDGSFGRRNSYAGAGSLAPGDFDGDGRLDLAVGGLGTALLLGNGDGSFHPGVVLETASSGSLATGDFDGDGDLDLATTPGCNPQTCGNYFSVFLNRGDGTFDPRTDYLLGSGVFAVPAVSAGDFDGDGHLDLVVSVQENEFGRLSLLRGNGDGTFGVRTDYGTGTGPAANWIEPGDLNGDGRLDVALAREGANRVMGVYGNGDGTFGSQLEYATTDNPNSVTIGELNGDGLREIVAVNYGRLIVIPGGTPSGGGTWTAAVLPSASVRLADLDVDGKLDAVAVQPDNNTVTVFPGNGGGPFFSATPTTLASFGVDLDPSFVVVADFNADGYSDLAVANLGSNTVLVLLNRLRTSGVGESLLPAVTRLQRVFPNPFRAGVTFEANVGRFDRAATLAVYDIRGRLVWMQKLSGVAPGRIRIPWDGRGSHGERLASSVYMVKLTASSGESTTKILRAR